MKSMSKPKGSRFDRNGKIRWKGCFEGYELEYEKVFGLPRSISKRGLEREFGVCLGISERWFTSVNLRPAT